LFPAQVERINEEGEYTLVSADAVRVIVTNDTFYVFVEGERGPEIAMEEYISDFSGTNVTGYTVITADDSEFRVTRAKHCGCGSRLRGFFPFPGVPITRVQ
jgi:hypothetical protein